MRVMILAAGRGERMRPLTDTIPKALLPAGGKPLLVWHLERLAEAGFSEIVINLAHLGGQIREAIGDGSRFGLAIAYSEEAPEALETAGGIARALPLLGAEPFLVINADAFCDWPFASAPLINMTAKLAHLVLVNNPSHNPKGDFALDSSGRIVNTPGERLTYAGIGVYSPELFCHLDPNTPARLAPLLHEAVARGLVDGEKHEGLWVDVGTPERLYDLDRMLMNHAQHS